MSTIVPSFGIYESGLSALSLQEEAELSCKHQAAFLEPQTHHPQPPQEVPLLRDGVQIHEHVGNSSRKKPQQKGMLEGRQKEVW